MEACSPPAQIQQWRRQRKIVAEEVKTKQYQSNRTKTINRLGTVFFYLSSILDFHICIPINRNHDFLGTFINMLCFCLWALFLSMIPSFDGMSKQAITKLFNAILTWQVTLIITTAFSISTMLYTLSAGYPFFWLLFWVWPLRITLGDLMSMFLWK